LTNIAVLNIYLSFRIFEQLALALKSSVAQKRKDFQVIAFGHSAFITSQSLFVPTNMVLKRYLACRTFGKC